jgi:hypothetical protein
MIGWRESEALGSDEKWIVFNMQQRKQVEQLLLWAQFCY